MILTHEIHSSELRAYRQCREYWNWRHRENWEPVKKSAALEDGTVWHKALEVLYDPETWSKPLDELYRLANSALIVEADVQKKTYLERISKYQLDDDEALDYADRVTLLRSMLSRLCRTLDRDKYKPIFVEQEFSCRILDEGGSQLSCHCDRCIKNANLSGKMDAATIYAMYQGLVGLPVTFNCRIDAGFEDREGYVYAVDHKSTAQLLREDSVFPELEDQLPLYLWCLRENGYRATGMILNQFRKSAPKPPKRLERMQYGRQFSVNRMQLTDVYTARATFELYDPRAYKLGLYEGYLTWLGEFGAQYSRQFVVFKTQEQLDIVGNNLCLQAKELINEGPAVYPSPNRINCNICSFQAPCFSKQSNADYKLELESSFVRTEPYYITRRQQT